MTDEVSGNQAEPALAETAATGLTNETKTEEVKTDVKTEAKAGERPEWLAEQYWNKETKSPNIEALAKAEKDLRQKVSQGLKEKPPESIDGYQVKLPEGLKTPVDDPAINLFKQVAHKTGLSQKSFEAILAEYVPALEALVAEKTAPLSEEQQAAAIAEANKAELAKLDPDPAKAQAKVNGVVQFFKGKVAQGSLEEADYKALMRMGGDAAGIQALSKVISTIYKGEGIPIVEALNQDGYSKAQYYTDVGSARYNEDPAFRAEVKAKFAKIVGEA